MKIKINQWIGYKIITISKSNKVILYGKQSNNKPSTIIQINRKTYKSKERKKPINALDKNDDYFIMLEDKNHFMSNSQ